MGKKHQQNRKRIGDKNRKRIGDKNRKRIGDKNWNKYIGIIPIVFSVISFIWMLSLRFTDDEIMIKSLQKDNDNLSEKVEALNSEYKEVNNSIEDINKQISFLKGALHIYPTEDGLKMVGSASNQSNNGTDARPSVSRTTVIGRDDKGNNYIAEDLINKTIIMEYEDDDKEVYFLGRYNENYHWQGFCLTNSYFMDGRLFGICESNLHDGQIKDYVSLYRENGNESEWTYTDRTRHKDKNSGISKSYFCDITDVKNFTETDIRITDFILIDDYIKDYNFQLRKYYIGDTSGGRYNDNTGNATLFEFSDNGTVYEILHGKFVNGDRVDSSNSAWRIKYDEDIQKYKKKSGNGAEKVVDVNQIEDTISGIDIDCELKWK